MPDEQTSTNADVPEAPSRSAGSDTPPPMQSVAPEQPSVVAPQPPTVPNQQSTFQPLERQDAASTPPGAGANDSSSGTALPPFVPQQQPKPKSKKRLWLIGVVVLILLLIGGGYVFAFYLPNSPSNVYSASLVNTGEAVDKLIDYSKQQQQTNYQSVAFNGKLNVKSTSGSFDATINGSGSKGNASVQATGDVLGEKVGANVRVVTAKGNTSPDVYLQVTGIKSLVGDSGLGGVGKLDGKWIAIDHTLIETYKSSLEQELNSATNGMASTTKVPTYAQVQDAVAKVQVVNKQYLFTSDTSKAVLANEQFVGKETVNGRTVNHYKVGYSKTNLQAYATAVGQALDSSQLNDWSKQANSGKNLSEVMDLSSLQNTIKNANANYTFNMWVDTQTKLISKLSFTDPSDTSSVFTIGQNYTGGSQYPFTFGFSGKDDKGNSQHGSLMLTLDTTSNKVSVSLTATSKDDSGTTNVTANLNVVPGKSPVTVTAPSGTTPVLNVLNSLGLGGLLQPPSNSSGLKTVSPTLQPGGPLIPAVPITGRT